MLGCCLLAIDGSANEFKIINHSGPTLFNDNKYSPKQNGCNKSLTHTSGSAVELDYIWEWANNNRVQGTNNAKLLESHSLSLPAVRVCPFSVLLPRATVK